MGTAVWRAGEYSVLLDVLCIHVHTINKKGLIIVSITGEHNQIASVHPMTQGHVFIQCVLNVQVD